MSDLLKFAKIQKDEDFVARVSAAMLIHAREISGWDLSVPSRDMMVYVQGNPLVPVSDMVLTVAINPDVIADVDIAHGVADATEVKDTDIQFVVNSEWDNVAARAFPAA